MRPALRCHSRFQSTLTLTWNRSSKCVQRTLHNTSKYNEKAQQHPIQGYTADLLDPPLRLVRPVTRAKPSLPPVTAAEEAAATSAPLPLTQKEQTLAKARVVFGSRISTAAERQAELDSRSQMVAGVLVPPKPEEPDNCCMSGCVNCVWERFREEMEEWAAKSGEARARVIELRKRGEATGMMLAATGGEEQGVPSHVAVSMDDDGGGSETNWVGAMAGPAAKEEGFSRSQDDDIAVDPLAGIPVGIREFMRTEKKLKERQRAAGTIADTALDKELRAQVWGAGT